MAVFEISVNGERRFAGDDVTAITLVADRIDRRQTERVSVHVGTGAPGERQVQYLGADLRPGDEISIRVLADDEPVAEADAAPDSCRFCGSVPHQVRSLVAGTGVAICDSCLARFDAVLTRAAALPVGASIRDHGDLVCGFCLRAPPAVAGLFVRNGAAICPECLHVCVDMTGPANG